jgi:hypothetical protein
MGEGAAAGVGAAAGGAGTEGAGAAAGGGKGSRDLVSSAFLSFLLLATNHVCKYRKSSMRQSRSIQTTHTRTRTRTTEPGNSTCASQSHLNLLLVKPDPRCKISTDLIAWIRIHCESVQRRKRTVMHTMHLPWAVTSIHATMCRMHATLCNQAACCSKGPQCHVHCSHR